MRIQKLALKKGMRISWPFINPGIRQPFYKVYRSDGSFVLRTEDQVLEKINKG